LSKPVSNKDKIGYVISMIFFAVCITGFGLVLTFVTMLSTYQTGQSKLFLIFLFPTITASIVVILAIMTVNTLTAKPDSSSKKTKISNKKPLLTAIVVGIAVIFTFALIWGSLLASSYRPPREYPQIYIKPDGTIQPPSTQIKQEDTLYTLQADITLNRFYIEKNDITLDGNGYKINIVGPTYKFSKPQGYIELSNVNNVTLTNLVTQMNTKLITQNSGHCTIQECNFLSFDIINSHHITITNNSKPYNYGKSTGLLLFESTNCTIQKSSMSELKLVRAHQNKILQNQIVHGSDNVLLWFEDSNCNILFNNYVNCDVSKLFSMTGQTSNNLIVANNFTDYAYYEPTFSHNGTNTFYHNNFFNANWLQSDPNFTQSKWDNGQTGNYWSNYQEVDQNNDGIGDNAHIIDQNNQDSYPLTNPINTNQEIQPQLPSYNQIPTSYTQNTQEESFQTTLIVIIVIATIIVVSLIFHKRKQIKS